MHRTAHWAIGASPAVSVTRSRLITRFPRAASEHPLGAVCPIDGNNSGGVTQVPTSSPTSSDLSSARVDRTPFRSQTPISSGMGVSFRTMANGAVTARRWRPALWSGPSTLWRASASANSSRCHGPNGVRICFAKHGASPSQGIATALGNGPPTCRYRRQRCRRRDLQRFHALTSARRPSGTAHPPGARPRSSPRNARLAVYACSQACFRPSRAAESCSDRIP